VADVVPPSTPLTCVTKMSEKCKSTSPRAIQMNNWQKTSSTNKKLDVKSQLENGSELLTYHIVIFTHISIHIIHDNTHSITEGAKYGHYVFV